MIDLLVVNYNTKVLLKRFLDTLHHDDDKETWSLYITDNGSIDGSAEFLSERVAEAYRVKSAWCGDNVGYATAMNMMARESDSDIIGILNADVWLSTRDVQKIQELFDEHQDMHIMGPKQRDERNFITHAGILGEGRKPFLRGWKNHDPMDRLFRDRVEAVTVSGSAYFIRRSAWEDLMDCDVYERFIRDELHLSDVPGAFLPTRHYYEETWCSYHARAHGMGVFYDGSVSIGHTWHASSELGGSADQEMQISKQLFRRACASHGIDCD